VLEFVGDEELDMGSYRNFVRVIRYELQRILYDL
jgi:hypothetical protein